MFWWYQNKQILFGCWILSDHTHKIVHTTSPLTSCHSGIYHIIYYRVFVKANPLHLPLHYDPWVSIMTLESVRMCHHSGWLKMTVSGATGACCLWEIYHYWPLMLHVIIARFIGPNMGPIWGRQDPGEPHVGPMNFAIWDAQIIITCLILWYCVMISFVDAFLSLWRI